MAPLNHLLLQLHSGRTTSRYFQPDDSLPCAAGDPNQTSAGFLELNIACAERPNEIRVKGTLSIRRAAVAVWVVFTTMAREFRLRTCPTFLIPSIRPSEQDEEPGWAGVSVKP